MKPIATSRRAFCCFASPIPAICCCAVFFRAPIAKTSTEGAPKYKKSWFRENEIGTVGLIALSGANLGDDWLDADAE